MAKARLSILVNAPGPGLAVDDEIGRLVGPVDHEWRLSSGNGRELGRSARTFPEADACRRDLLELQTRIADASALITSAGGGGCWTWRLQLGPQGPAAVGGRRYARRRECRYNLDRFIEALADLEPPRDLFGLTYRRLVTAATIDLTRGTSPQVPQNDAPVAGLTWNRDISTASVASSAPARDTVSPAPAPDVCVTREPAPISAGERRAGRALKARPAPAPLADRRLQPLVWAPAPRLAWQPAMRLAGYR